MAKVGTVGHDEVRRRVHRGGHQRAGVLQLGHVLRGQLAPRRERVVLWGGLKGAVPILLGTYVLAAGVSDAARFYAIVFVVVAFSVVVQGGLLPTLASRLRVPMRTVETEPWSLGVRLRHEPDNLRRLVIASGAVADGESIDPLGLEQGT
jgi:cell volume regulation protein A